MAWSDVFPILKQTASCWVADKAPRLGAALAFYSVLSLAPLVVIVLAIAGTVFGEEAARGEIVAQIEGMVGREGAEAVEDLVLHSQRPKEGKMAAMLGTLTLLFGASGVFGELQDSLNTIWKVKPKPGRGLITIIRERFFSFAMVFGTAFLLMVSLVISAVLAAAGKYMAGKLDNTEHLWSALEILVSSSVLTILFALIFKAVPDVKIGWRDTLVGAVVTAILFTLGKYLLGLYLGRSGMASAYGAAGSLVVLVVWIYYSAQILYFGAELTQACTHHFRKYVPPTSNAEPVTSDTANTVETSAGLNPQDSCRSETESPESLVEEARRGAASSWFNSAVRISASESTGSCFRGGVKS